MDNCRRWFPCASCLGCRFCVERFPTATHEAIRLEYFRSHTDLYDQYFCAGHRCFFRWSLPQSHRTQNCRSHGRVSVGLGNLPGKFLRSPALVALLQLWGNRRHRSWIEAHSAGRRPLVKWFPDRRGRITGVAVGGFAAGALVTAPVAKRLIQSVGVLSTFAYLGIGLLIDLTHFG